MASWRTAEHMVTVLRRVVTGCRPSARLIYHSDQGSQYTSDDLQRQCAAYGIRQSMGSVGDCHDNAMAESAFSTIETELLDRNRFENREAARRALIQYIDGIYNSRRLHSSLGHRMPVEYEQCHAETA